jgi:putative ABC transport system permease protein
VLRHYPAVLAAVVAAAALAAAAAASGPFVRAGIESASLRGQVRTMSPLAAGLELRTGGSAAQDRERRARAAPLSRMLGLSATPVLTSRIDAQVATSAGEAPVVVMARTGALQHVARITHGSGEGAWVSTALADPYGLHPGDTLHLVEGLAPSIFTPATPRRRRVALRIAGVYRALDRDLGNPYWANFVQDIRAPNPDAAPPPTFVLVPESTFLEVATRLRVPVANVVELPVDPSGLTYAGAERLNRRFERAHGTSALGAALIVARRDTDAVNATITLLATVGLAVALLVAAAAGVFLVRRRKDEATLRFVRGEGAATFGARVAAESVLPAIAGAALGFGAARLALHRFSPAGALDGAALRAGILAAGVAGACALAAVAIAAACAFPRRHDTAHPALGRLARLPWETIPLAAASVLIALVVTGGGLAGDASGHTHPAIGVFLLPMLAAAAIAGLASRAARRLLHGRGGGAPVPVFLAVRRLVAARGFLVVVLVSAATAIAAYAYAATLSASLSRSAAEKAFVSNGSDVQGVVDTSVRLSDPLPFPAAIVHVDQRDTVADGRPIDLVSGDPASIARVIRWGAWRDDPRTQLRRLARTPAHPGTLPALASPGMPRADAITYQGVRVPIVVVARGLFPGLTAGRPALLVPARTLHAIAVAKRLPDPGPSATALVWAKGNPRTITPVLERSSLNPVFLTTLSHVRTDPSVVAGERSYRYVRAVAATAAALALVALLLYLQARQRERLLASAFLRRMGFGALADGATLALEAIAIVVAAGLVGCAVALAIARVVLIHVDPLPQYAPGTALVYPWPTLAWAGAAACVAAAAFAAAALLAGRRADVAQELRVA